MPEEAKPPYHPYGGEPKAMGAKPPRAAKLHGSSGFNITPELVCNQFLKHNNFEPP